MTAAAPARGRWRDQFAAEWLKFWSLRSTALVLGTLVPYYLYVAYRSATRDRGFWQHMDPGMRTTYDLGHAAFDGPMWFPLMIAVGTLGALTVAGEYAGGLVRPTFAAVPARHRVMTAKAAVLAVVTTGLGLVLALGAFLIASHVMSGHVHESLTDPAVVRSIGATTVFVPVCALVGMGVGALVRNVAASVFTVCAVFLFLPVALKGTSHKHWVDTAVQSMPWYAWGRLTSTSHGGHIVGAVTSMHTAWISLAAWALCALLAAFVVVDRRDT